MRDFRKLDIWVNSVDFVTEIYEMTNAFPESEKFGITSQMRRAAVSIPSNIAEGAGRSSKAEFKRFLEISLGSTFELETQLIVSEKLGFVKQNTLEIKLDQLSTLQKQVNNLISKIKQDIQIKANS